MNIAIAAALLICAPALAGDLNPPPGPVTETMKTLVEVEPRTAISNMNTPGDSDSRFRISQPGSYYLTEEVTHRAGQRGIEISASNVTLDLNGFAIRSTEVGSLQGIGFVGATGDSITIRNGTIQDSTGGGIRLAVVSQASVEDVNIRNVGGEGIDLGAMGEVRGCEVRSAASFGIRVQNGRIERCAVDQATQIGIQMSSTGVISDCQVFGFVGDGFRVGSDVTLERCQATSVTDGFISTGAGNTFRDCNASFCFDDGFSIDGPAVLIGCTARQNTTFGIDCFDAGPCRIESCVAEGNGVVGITGGNGSTISGCSAFNNGSNIQHSGIRIIGSGTIVGCTSSNNTGQGIEISSALENSALIADCVVDNNTGHGIVTGDGTVVRGCATSRNGLKGIDGGFSVSISNSSAIENGDDGIQLGSTSTVVSCVARGNNGNGIVGQNAAIFRCTAAQNTQTGISAQAGGSITECVSLLNLGSGFFGTVGAIIEGCEARANSQHGISLTFDSEARKNLCIGNTLDGIRVNAGGCVLDGNTVLENLGNGIRVAAPGCFIVRNRARNNTIADYDINAGNDAGPIQTSVSAAGPWDNFIY